MQQPSDSIRAALLLTNRLVPLDAEPLTAREFWHLVGRVDPGDLIRHDPATIADVADVEPSEAVRYRTLLDAATALSFEQERLADHGIGLVCALDDGFPAGLRTRLGAGCPPFLLVAGPTESLSLPCLGIVGSRHATDGARAMARRAAEAAARHGRAVVNGLAHGIDHVVVAGVADAGGVAVGVPAEGILRASRSSEVRRRVHDRELCIISPFAPDAPLRAGAATGRDRIVSGLAQVIFVVTGDERSGGTWPGADDALQHGHAPVAVWAGEGASDGNRSLIRRGAVPITTVEDLFEIDPTSPRATPVQDTLF